MESSVNVFRETGLYSLNRHIFQDYNFPFQPLTINQDTQSSVNSAVSVSEEPIPGAAMQYYHPTFIIICINIIIKTDINV